MSGGSTALARSHTLVEEKRKMQSLTWGGGGGGGGRWEQRGLVLVQVAAAGLEATAQVLLRGDFGSIQP